MNIDKTSSGSSLVLRPITAFFLVLALVLFGFTNHVRAGVISQVPLFVSLDGVNPNIMFILDDSGSMQWEVLPDGEISNSIYYMLPTNQSSYGSSWYTYSGNRVTSLQGGFEDNNIHNFRRRSSKNNASFYNPQITYRPWAKADSTTFPDANIACAYHNPANTALGCRNFTVQSTGDANTPTDSYGRWLRLSSGGTYSWTEGKYVNAQTGVAGFWPATYFNWTPGGTGCALPGNINTRACYTKVEIRTTTNTYVGGVKRGDCAAAPVCTYAEEIQNFANWYTYYRSRILSARAGIGKAFSQQKETMRVGFGAINKGSSTIDGVPNTKVIIKGVRSFSAANRQDFFDRLYNHVMPASNTPLRAALDAAGQYFSRTDNQGPWCDVPGSVSSTTYSCRRSYTILMTDGYWNGAGAFTAGAAQNNDGTAGPTITGPAGQAPFTYAAVSPFTDGNANTLADIAMYYWKRDLQDGLENRVPVSDINPAFWQHMVTFGVGLGVFGAINPDNAFAAINDPAITINWPTPSDGGTSQNIDDLLHASVNGRGGFFSAADPDVFATRLSNVLQDIVSREETSSAALATNSTKFDTGTTSYRAKFNSTNWSGQLIAYQFNSNGTLGAESWNTDTTGKIPAHGSRKIFTMVGSTGQPFMWANLDVGQQTALKTLNAVVDTDLVGQRRLNWIRGDQSNEKPSGTLRQRTRLLGDIINSDPFYVNGSPPMLYVGANDGMLHAFNAATGVEQFAYIPKSVFANLSSLPDSGYNHKYFVDGSPIVTKLDDNRLILLGTTGAGGRSVFALDVTDPVNFNASKVLWELTNPDLGYTLAQPSIGRLKDGTWVAVFGNGYSSDSGKAFLFVVNLTSGALIAKIATSNDVNNGLAKPALLPDADGRIVAAYAGDLQGKLWKFDLTSNTVAFGGAALFTAKNAAGVTQPITSAPVIGRHPDGGYLLFFGTGKYFEIGDHSAINAPVQSLYGIWDTALLNSGAWQGGTVISATDRSVLQAQQIIGESVAVENKWRILSENPVNWTGAEAKRGWYLDLVVGNKPVGERVTDTPVLNMGRVIFTTRIPFNEADPCIPSVGTSWFMAVDMFSGGRIKAPVFDVNRDGKFDDFDKILVGGNLVAVSGFEAIAAGMSRVTLIQFSEGSIDVLLSGTSSLTTTASSTQDADGAGAKAAAAVAQAAQSAFEQAVAQAQAAAVQAQAEAAAAQAAAAAAAAQAAAAVSSGASPEAQAAAAAAAAAAAQAATDAAAAAAAAQAAADAAPNSGTTATSVRNAAEAAAAANPASAEATAVLDAIVGALNSGRSPIEAVNRGLEVAGSLQGLGEVGVRVAGQILPNPPQKTWRQLR